MPTLHHQIDFRGLADWVEIFRAGRQTDSQGRTRSFTRADLDQVVANHDPAHPAPHVITHKSLYSPFAYGQSAALKREGDSLYVRSTKIEPQFEQLVKAGRLFERSVRLLPTAKGWKLSHIAWLGAEPPAVEGMAPVSFEAAGDGFDYSFDAETPSALVRMMRNMREFLIEKFGADAADKVMPSFDIDQLNTHIDKKIAEEAAEEAAEGENNQTTGDGIMPDFTQADIDAAKAAGKREAEADFARQRDELSTQLAGELSKRKRSECDAIVGKHIQRGVAPAILAGASEFMLTLDDGESFEYSQGSGDKAATTKTSPRDYFAGILDKLPATVDMTETKRYDSHMPPSDYSAPRGFVIDPDALDLHNKALEYQRQHQCDYVTAVTAVGA